jgi:hypothetical protein
MADSADVTYLNQSQTVLPEYQEKFYKDFLASVSEQGKKDLLAGVPSAELAGFTPAQLKALKMGMENVGAYQPMMDAGAKTLNEGIGVYQDALGAYGKGVDALGGTTGAFDPQSYKDFMNPYTQEVIDTTSADINRQADIERNRLTSNAVSQGAFGGSRGAIQQSELTRNTADQQARTGAGLRSAGFDKSMGNAMSAFSDQMRRGQNAAQIFGSLGSGIGSIGSGLGEMGVRQGAMGEAAQAAGTRDVNSLFNLGSLEQGQIQAGYDVERQNALETANEPFRRLGFMSDMFRGVPSSQGTMTMGTTPSPSPYSTFLGTAMGLGGLRDASGSSLLGGIMNSSGA